MKSYGYHMVDLSRPGMCETRHETRRLEMILTKSGSDALPAEIAGGHQSARSGTSFFSLKRVQKETFLVKVYKKLWKITIFNG